VPVEAQRSAREAVDVGRGNRFEVRPVTDPCRVSTRSLFGRVEVALQEVSVQAVEQQNDDVRRSVQE
jgi:hypothetical protein